MRINRYIALSTGLSRRSADAAITAGRVLVNGTQPSSGHDVVPADSVLLDGKAVHPPKTTTTIILNKPVSFVCSRDGQGSKTIYELLPPNLHHLKPIGRLDKYSSGLLLMSDDGKLAQQLTHPSFQKKKIYNVTLDRELSHNDALAIENGIPLEDGLSRLQLDGQGRSWVITMHEGRNRQIRRTFAACGYEVVSLQRTAVGSYVLGTLKVGTYRFIK